MLWGDPKDQAGHHIAADFVALVAGLSGANAPGEYGAGGSCVHCRGSLFGPRGWAEMQEVAAAAFRWGSRAVAREETGRNPLQRGFPSTDVAAGGGGKGTIDAVRWGSGSRQSFQFRYAQNHRQRLAVGERTVAEPDVE